MMKKEKLRIGVIDLVAKAPTRRMYGRVMNANNASLMSQVVACWCEQQGHEVSFVCYTGRENLFDELPPDTDLVFIGAFTQSAQLSYALSNLLRHRGSITALGGPHARAFPQDAQKYFDYVLGFTDKELILSVLKDCSAHRPTGLFLSSKQQPSELPGVRERWKFIQQTHQKAPLIKIVPMISSLGCPYNCNFCVDANVPFQQLSLEVIQEDLRFLLQKFKRPHVGWHDPNWGVRFDDIMDAIEEAIPPNSIDFVAETSLSLLSEHRLKRLQRNGFKAILPGIESWYDMGEKSKSGSARGVEKVKKVSDHINLIMEHIPYIQVNFILGLDTDQGSEPFELTKKFLDLTPGAFPAYSLLLVFGEATPLSQKYQGENRLLPFPFHFMNNSHIMNVKPKHYSWTEFYDYLIDLTRYSFSWPMIFKRHRAIKHTIPRWMNVLRAVSSEGFGRIKYYTETRQRLDTDQEMRRYFEGETAEIPNFYVEWVKRDLGPFWEWLPDGALNHDID